MSRYTPDALELAVHSALKLCLPDYAAPTCRILFANQDAPRLDGTFLTLYVTGAVTRGTGEEAMGDDVDVDGLYGMTRREVREATVSVQGYGPDAWVAIQTLASRMFHPSLVWQIQALGLCFVEPITTQRLSAALGPESENRAALTATVRHLRDDTLRDRDVQRVGLTPALDTDTFPQVIVDLATP